MSKTTKKPRPKRPNNAKKPRHNRKKYAQTLKQKARYWKFEEHMKPTHIQKRLLQEDNLEVPLPTLSDWWSPKTMQHVENLAEDRLNVPDVRINRAQRPDVMVDMEKILARKIFTIKLHGLPYSRDILQVLAIHIYHKLQSYGLYNERGQRKNPGQPIEEDMLQAVEKARLTTNYLAKSNRKTEFHKSFEVTRNAGVTSYGPTGPNRCKFCPRLFKDSVNLTLHVYYHAVYDTRKAAHEDPTQEGNSASEEDEEDPTSVLKFKASPGWIEKFLQRHEVGRYKMKGEKGSADYEAVDPWIHEWLTFLHTDYVLRHKKTLRQVLNIVVNFDECGFQYKSLPQYSYLIKNQEIRAKKPQRARITGLFGATANGHKFKPLIIGKSKTPRPFLQFKRNNQTISDVLDVNYDYNENAWMTGEIFRNWFITCFLHEISPLIDPDMDIQFLLDNCTAHPISLDDLDPYVSVKFLPANTTSIIQPMDQAVLACVKSFQKKKFYYKMFQYCEKHQENPKAFNDFLKEYTILEAIQDIEAGWKQVSEATIVKSFRKVFPIDKWNEVTGGTSDEPEGFDAPDSEIVRVLQPNIENSIDLPGHHAVQRTQITNDDFESDINDILEHLNKCQDGVTFEKEHVVEDVLLNPGPADENIDTIVRDVLQVEDTTCTGDDMPDVELIPTQPDEMRPKVLKALSTISELKYSDITESMPHHKLDEWRELMAKTENLALSCFGRPTTTSTKHAIVPSTSTDVNNNKNTNGATKIPATTINESTDTTSEETMPASIMMDIVLNNDTSCEDEDGMIQVTTFRAIQESVE